MWLLKNAENIARFVFDPKTLSVLLVLLAGFVVIGICEGMVRFSAWNEKRRAWNAILEGNDDSIFCGKTDKGLEVHLKPSQRAMHTQVIGTTNAGKTESVILPWAIQDIYHGRGLLIVDGKSDRGILDKLYAYSVKAGRAGDFRLFSLSHVEESNQFNPLIGGTAEEITERVFNSFDIENPYYRSIQFEVLVQTLRIFEELKIVPTFERVHQAISEPERLLERSAGIPTERLKNWLGQFVSLPARDRLERTSGLLSGLGQFAFGRHADLFRTENPELSIEEALSAGKIVYFQLPVLLAPFLGKATGKLVLQTLQAAIANRHRSKEKEKKFFSVFLDDFTEYLYPGFVSILNKSRSARVGVVFAHQALGDIEGLGPSIANSILTNSNLKVFMRGTDPETAEYFSRVIGTKTTTKATERTKKATFGQQATGDQSVREVEEFIIHPNRFKSALGVGEAYLVLPHASGARTEHVRLKMFPDIEAEPLPIPRREISHVIPRLVKEAKKEDEPNPI
jgi:hypothetical protein